MTEVIPPRQGSYGRQLRLTTVGTASALLAALLLQVVLAVRFGVSAELDRFLLATTLPTVVAAVLSTAIIQLLVPAIHRDRAGRSSDTPSLTRRFLVASLVCLLLLELFAPAWLRVLTAGQQWAGRQETVALFRVLSLGVPLYAISSIQTAWLHSVGRTVRVAHCAAIPFILMAAATFWGFDAFGLNALVWGQVAGYLLQVVALGRLAITQMLSRDPEAQPAQPGLPWARRGGPGLVLVAASVHLLMPVVERRYAVGSGPGAVAALAYAGRLTATMGVLAGAAVGAMTHGVMALEAAREEIDDFAAVVGEAVARVVLLAFGALALLLALAGPMAAFVTRTTESSLRENDVASLVRLFAFAVLGMAIGEVVGRAAYVQRWYRELAALAVINLVIMVTFLSAWPGTVPIEAVAAAEVAWWLISLVVLLALLLARVPTLRHVVITRLLRRWRPLGAVVLGCVALPLTQYGAPALAASCIAVAVAVGGEMCGLWARSAVRPGTAA